MTDRRFIEVRDRLEIWLRAEEDAPAGLPSVAPQPVACLPRDAYEAGFRAGQRIARERYERQVDAAERQLRQAQRLLRQREQIERRRR